jgi:hypothetical protein
MLLFSQKTVTNLLKFQNATDHALEINFPMILYNLKSDLLLDRLRSLVVRVPGYRSRGPGSDSRSYQIF